MVAHAARRAVLIRRAGTADHTSAPSPYTVTVKQRLDPDATADAAVAMEALRDETAEREPRAHERHLEAATAPARRPYDDALRAVDHDAAQEQRRAEVEMYREPAKQEAAQRRAHAARGAPAAPPVGRRVRRRRSGPALAAHAARGDR